MVSETATLDDADAPFLLVILACPRGSAGARSVPVPVASAEPVECGVRLRVKGSGSRVWGLGFRV